MNVAEQLDADAPDRDAIEIDRELNGLAGFGLTMRDPAVGVGARVWMREAVLEELRGWRKRRRTDRRLRSDGSSVSLVRSRPPWHQVLRTYRDFL